MKFKLDGGAFAPVREHKADAGMDLRTPVAFKMIVGERVLVDTGVHVEIPYGFVGYVLPKSGLASRGILAEVGTIDSGYTGSIKVNLVNTDEFVHLFEVGDKIAQVVIHKVELPDVEIVDYLRDTDRGDRGFGSTGR